MSYEDLVEEDAFLVLMGCPISTVRHPHRDFILIQGAWDASNLGRRHMQIYI